MNQTTITMPTFTITKDGQTLNTLQLEEERIELGSANSCQIFLDDLLISLKQAAIVKTPDGYQIEPLARTPVFTVNGQTVEGPVKVASGSVLEVEGYKIQMDFQPSSTARQPDPSPPPPLEETPKSTGSEDTGSVEEKKDDDLPPLPPPLDLDSKPAVPPASELKPPAQTPDLPPPLEPEPEPQSTPEQKHPPSPPSQSSEEKTVFVAKPVGQLVAVSGPLGARSWPLRPGEVKIGRDQGQNDIVIRTDAKGQIDKSISRRHATVHVTDAGVTIEDQNSAAGTFVNGRQVQPGNRVPISNGDQVEIRSAKESSVFRVELIGAAAPATPAQSTPPPPPPIEPSPPKADVPPAPPQPARQPEPRYEPPPRTSEPEPDSPRRRRRRGRSAAGADENPFAPGAPAPGAGGIPKWVWIAAGAAVVLLVIVLIFLLR